MTGSDALLEREQQEAGKVRAPADTRRAFLGMAAAFAATAAEAALREALAAAPAPVQVWWRNDDVRFDSPRFARLLAVAQRQQAPVALATVPVGLRPACVQRILSCGRALVIQHGIAHVSHAAPGERPLELGGGLSDPADLAAGLSAGRQRLAEAFGPKFLPMQAPPWGRIDPGVMAMLPALGFTSLSTFGRRRAPQVLPSLWQVNCHLGLHRWAAPSGPLPYEEAVARLTALVRRSRGEPIGILTHHKVMNEEAFVTLDRLLAFIKSQPNMRLAGIESLVPMAG